AGDESGGWRQDRSGRDEEDERGGGTQDVQPRGGGHGDQEPVDRHAGSRGPLRRRRPAAAERAVEQDEGEQLVALGLRQRQLSVEELALGVEDLEIARDAAPVPDVRRPRRVAQRVDEEPLLDAELAPLPML